MASSGERKLRRPSVRGNQDWIGPIAAGSNEVTLNFSFCWDKQDPPEFRIGNCCTLPCLYPRRTEKAWDSNLTLPADRPIEAKTGVSTIRGPDIDLK